MCGICGIIRLDTTASPVRRNEINIMNRLIAHRGPDGEGDWIDPAARAGLGHRRLSIIDLSVAASQPMHARTGRIIVFNGEMYNYVELRTELADRWTFRTSSDTET